MFKPLDIEMKLVDEPAAVRTDELPVTDNKPVADNKPDTSSEILYPETERIDSKQPESLSITPQSSKQSRKWLVFLKNIDPIFYITCLVFSGLFVAGLYLFINHNNRLIVAHLQEIEAGKKELSDKLALLKSEIDTQLPQSALVSQNKVKLAPLVKTQGRDDGVLVQASSQLAVVAESHDDIQSVDNEKFPILPAGVDQSEEISNLQTLLAEKIQQLELLALENYELRLTVEFGEAANTYPAVDFESDSIESSTEDAKIVAETDQSGIAASETQHETVLVDADELIRRAEQALNDKDYVDSHGLYLDALQQSPGNREANLGAASVALIMGNTQLAVDRYRHLLKLNPDDQSAFSAMLDLAAPENLLETELLSHVPRYASDPAKLYSILGHYFGRDAKWGRANELFNKALNSGGSSSADILFNLAVSYEHLGKGSEAVRVYLQALSAADDAGIDRALVRDRLSELTK